LQRLSFQVLSPKISLRSCVSAHVTGRYANETNELYMLQIVNPNNKSIRDIPGLAPPAPTSRRLLSMEVPHDVMRMGAKEDTVQDGSWLGIGCRFVDVLCCEDVERCHYTILYSL
ncbi:hypothetical protein ACLOJK_022045, partial [Asimina triloba]